MYNKISETKLKPDLDAWPCFQPSDAVELCSFELYNQSQWKLMAEDAIRSVCDGGLAQWPVPPPLCANQLDAAVASNDLEHQLRMLVTEHPNMMIRLVVACSSGNIQKMCCMSEVSLNPTLWGIV